MKAKKIVIFLLLAVIGCKQETKISSTNEVSLSQNLKFEEQQNIIKISSGKFQYQLNKNKIPFEKIVVLNASLLGYIEELNAEDRIVGVSSPEYIYSEKINALIAKGKIQNVGNEQKFDVEKIISLKPDAVLSNYIASFDNTYQVLKNNGIDVLFLDEYTEQLPLEKTAYLKLFGNLLGLDEIANSKYEEIAKNYQQIKILASRSSSKPKVLANEMYGDIWYLPGGATSVAHFISDANAQYVLQNNQNSKSVTMSFEQVFATSYDVNFWVNAGNHKSKNDLLAINPFYNKLSVFKSGKIYSISAKEKDKANDFFCSGVVRADLVLKDYVKIFHPELLPNYTLTYMKELL
ncbi:ABC transporter substrate-binding protein [Chryseobacterium sp.]|uniref:ABC transporter substrate-binding protein n=1 Tax=Chryseobacterium sp. TaxID=1871047 RepID=UPI00388EAD1A